MEIPSFLVVLQTGTFSFYHLTLQSQFWTKPVKIPALAWKTVTFGWQLSPAGRWRGAKLVEIFSCLSRKV